jgi:hypothetical protein
MTHAEVPFGVIVARVRMSKKEIFCLSIFLSVTEQLGLKHDKCDIAFQYILKSYCRMC